MFSHGQGIVVILGRRGREILLAGDFTNIGVYYYDCKRLAKPKDNGQENGGRTGRSKKGPANAGLFFVPGDGPSIAQYLSCYKVGSTDRHDGKFNGNN